MANFTNSILDPDFISGAGFDRITAIVYAILGYLLILAIWFGNGLVLVAIATTPNLRNMTNLLVFNLSLCDMFTGFIFIPCNIWANTSPRGAENAKPLCLSCLGLVSISCSVSIETLLAIAVERYIKIVHALSYPRIITKFRLIVAVIVIWISNLILHSSEFIWNNYDSEKSYELCMPVYVAKTAYLIVAMLTVAVAMVIINILYFKIFIIARKQRNEIIAMNVSVGVSSSTANDNKLVKTMALVNGLLYIFWAPLFTLVFAQKWIDEETLDSVWLAHVYAYLQIFLVGNSFVNPIIYAVRTKDFKDAFKRLLNCMRTGVWLRA